MTTSPLSRTHAGATGAGGPSASLWDAFAVACLEALMHQRQDPSCDAGTLEGIGLAAWDAQVGNEIAQRHRIADDSRVSPELEVLDELAVLTTRYADNGPWKAAEALFGDAA